MEQYLRCIQCGNEFTHWNNCKSYCPECSEARLKKNKGKKTKAKTSKQTLTEVLKELAEYNKEHGTSLSYGQYVSMNR